jgi:hypothetical protein
MSYAAQTIHRTHTHAARTVHACRTGGSRTFLSDKHQVAQVKQLILRDFLLQVQLVAHL